MLLITAALITLMLEAIGNPLRSSNYEKPHIKLLALGALLSAIFIILIDLSTQTLLSRRPHLFFDNISSIFLLLNSVISIHVGHKTLAKKSHNDIFFLLLSSVVIGIFIIWTDFLLIKMLGSTAWLLTMAALSAKTTDGGKRAEIALKLSYSAILVFLLFLFCFYFFSCNFSTLTITTITNNFALITPPTSVLIATIFLALAGLGLSGIPPFAFAHIDCADGSNLSTGFLVISNSMILGATHLLDVKNMVLTWKIPETSLSTLGYVLAAGLLIAWLRALDQSKIKRCVSYIAASISPLFCLSLLFGTSALIPELIFLIAIFTFATLGIFALFGSLAYLEPLDLPWQTWEDMTGLGRKNKIQALYLLIALASVAGLPGTLGYFVKLSLIAPMKENSWFNSMIFISIAVGAACTMRFFVFLFSKQSPSLELQNSNPSPPYSLLAAAIVLIILGFFPFVS
jgi:NADH-quinone oxidoreductase subunit N